MTIDEIRALRAVYPKVSAMGNTIYFHDVSQGGGRSNGTDRPPSASWVALPGQHPSVQAIVLAPQTIDFLLSEVERLHAWIMKVHSWTATCDWGDCNGESVGYRAWPDLGAIQEWISVCQIHLNEAPEDEGLYLGAQPQPHATENDT